MQDVQKWTVQKALKWTNSFFKEKKIENPRLQAELLLAKTLGITRIDLYVQYDRPLKETECSKYRESIKKRINGVPLQHLTGVQPFRHLVLDVNPGVFIPRPETEILVDKALEVIPKKGTDSISLDLGTGSGAVALSLVNEKEKGLVVGIDISRNAVILANKNSKKYRLEDRAFFIQGDFFQPIRNSSEGIFSLIISNPPYISGFDIESLPVEVKKYEPNSALYGGKKGIEIINKIIKEAPRFLKKNGYLLLEIGQNQAGAIKEKFNETKAYARVEVFPDLAGIDRIIRAQRLG